MGNEQMAPITVQMRVPATKAGQRRVQLARSADAFREALRARGINVGAVQLVNESTGAEISVITSADMTAASATQ